MVPERAFLVRRTTSFESNTITTKGEKTLQRTCVATSLTVVFIVDNARRKFVWSSIKKKKTVVPSFSRHFHDRLEATLVICQA